MLALMSGRSRRALALGSMGTVFFGIVVACVGDDPKLTLGSTDGGADDGCPPLAVRETLEGTSCDSGRALPGNGCALCSSNVECCRHVLVCEHGDVDTWQVLELGPCE